MVVRTRRRAGASTGYLDTPGDAYRLPNGNTTVADIRNCRIVELTRRGKVTRVLGGSCTHRLSASGRLLWSVRSPASYPSDAQLLPNGEILVASFESPGKIVELTHTGRVTWSFGNASGPDMLNLDKPDGIDLLPAAAVTHSVLSAKKHIVMTHHKLVVTRVGSMPQATSRIAAVALGNRVLAFGGLIGGTPSTQILAGPPSHLVSIGTLPIATHDDAAVVLGTRVYLLGGGQETTSDAVVRITAAGRARRVGSLGEPLSDLGAVKIGSTAYIAGGYTGAKYATGILAFRGGTPKLAARLPVGLRYAGVAALNGNLYVAGGLTTAGLSNASYSFDPRTHKVRRVATCRRPLRTNRSPHSTVRST